MLPGSNKGVGGNVGFPDICLTPIAEVPVPIPYVNLALHAMAVPFAETVMVSMVPGLNMMSEIPATLGDEPGVDSPHGGPGFFTLGNPVVFVEEMPGINLLCLTSGNDFIDPIGAVVIPALTNVFYTERPALADCPATLSIEGSVATVVLPSIPADAGACVAALLEQVAPARDVVLDLRGNGGGVLTAAADVAGLFLSRGTPICQVLDEDGDERMLRSRNTAPCTLPLTVLIDHGTASAAEILAAALQTAGRARVEGQPSYGKATGLCLGAGRGGDPRRPGRLLVRRPDGSTMHGVGVKPDAGASEALQD